MARCMNISGLAGHLAKFLKKVLLALRDGVADENWRTEAGRLRSDSD